MSFLSAQGDLFFFNEFTSQYWSGTPISLNQTAEPTNWYYSNWLTNVAFSPTLCNVDSNRVCYLYFPSVADSPTANENITTAASSTDYRFLLNPKTGLYPIDGRLISARNTSSSSSSFRVSINSQQAGSTAVPISTTVTAQNYVDSNVWDTSIAKLTRYDWFGFGVKSPTTLVLFDFSVSVERGGDVKTDYSTGQILICGWLHDSIYQNAPAAPETEHLRFNGCYALSVSDSGKNATSYATFSGVRPVTKGLTTSQSLQCRYYDITSGLYVQQQQFLTDLILCDATSPFRQIGKVDNRVVCLGRGTFQKGTVYAVTNPFGRSGTEYWFCLCKYVPSSYAVPTWTPGYNLDTRHTKVWQSGQEDFLLVRVQWGG